MEFRATPGPSRLWTLLLVVPLAGLLVGASVLVATPRLAYTLSAAALDVEAGVGFFGDSFSVARSDITAARPIEVNGASRRAGTAVPGYCGGAWKIGGEGAVTLATDCRKAAVAIEAKSGVFVVSPPDREAFLEALAKPGATWSAEVPPTPRPLWAWILAAAMLGLPLAALAFFGRVFRQLVYRVEGDELVVPRHLGELRVPLRGVRVAEGDLSRAFRLAGTGMPGLWLGMFRDKEGGFHACGSRRTDGLMVYGPRRVYVTPDDKRAFLDAVLRAGAVSAESGR